MEAGFADQQSWLCCGRPLSLVLVPDTFLQPYGNRGDEGDLANLTKKVVKERVGVEAATNHSDLTTVLRIAWITRPRAAFRR